ncbi:MULTISPECIES: hypothetical protein [Amycolatopsis]|uniref:Uncharacterized protein n=1 Tax=Amycolatopsis dongchuanensis TaxID=1070866 RepID=A0ABP9R853_9PSEU
MPRTFIRFRNVGFWAPDAHTQAWMYLVCAEIDGMTEPPGWLLEAREWWFVLATVRINGVMDPSYDTYLGEDEARIGLVQEIHERVLSRFKSFGEKMPRLSVPEGVHAFDGSVDTELYAETFASFAGLLRGEGEDLEPA